MRSRSVRTTSQFARHKRRRLALPCMTRIACLLLLAACGVEPATDETVDDITLQRVTYFTFEAESGALTAPMQVGSSGTASNGKYAIVPTTAGSGGSASYAFTATDDYTLHVWARVLAPSTSSNRISFKLDSNPTNFWDLPISSSWQWVQLPTTWSALTGTHSFVMNREESGVAVDRILMTNSNSFTPVVATFQAESASLFWPMQAAGSLFTTRYIYVPNGYGAAGHADLATPVPTGSYFLWARTNAPTWGDNTFSVDGHNWEAPVAANAWAWSRLTYDGVVETPVALDGTSVLSIEPIDDGLKLDQIVVTNDRGFKMVEPPPPMNTL